MPDHVHLLFLQNPNLLITDIIKQAKGATSHWINEEKLLAETFAWQTGYAAFSVSESQLDRVYTISEIKSNIIGIRLFLKSTKSLFPYTDAAKFCSL